MNGATDNHVNTPDFSNLQGTILGIDYGMKKIGFAIGDTISLTAEPEGICKVRSRDHALAVICAKTKSWRPVALVVGLPLKKDGQAQWMTHEVRKMVGSLERLVQPPIFLSDERYTTKVAQQMLRESEFSKKSKQVDDWAATLILQSWLNQR